MGCLRLSQGEQGWKMIINLSMLLGNSGSCWLVSYEIQAGSISIVFRLGPGRTNRVAIGTLTYLGTDQFGSAFRVALDAR